MDIKKLMAVVESERLSRKVHKTTLCASAGISTTYYNELLIGAKNPSITVISNLLEYFELKLIVAKVY